MNIECYYINFSLLLYDLDRIYITEDMAQMHKICHIKSKKAQYVSSLGYNRQKRLSWTPWPTRTRSARTSWTAWSCPHTRRHSTHSRRERKQGRISLCENILLSLLAIDAKRVLTIDEWTLLFHALLQFV